MKAARLIVRHLDELDEEDQRDLVKSIESIIKETPNAPAAQSRFKTLMKSVGKEGKNAIRMAIYEVLGEAAKRALYG